MKHRWLGPTPEFPQVRLEIPISNEFPGYADSAGP